MTRALWSIAISLILVLTALPAKAVSTICPGDISSCVITDPVYVNVYWDTSEQQWNSDIIANDKNATVGRIDLLTAAICHSNYFNGLFQYDIHSCSTQQSIIESGCGPPPSDLDQAHSKLGDFTTCVMSTHPSLDPQRTILNVFLPPQTAPASPNSDFCKKDLAEHHRYGPPWITFPSSVEATFIPTNSSCSRLIAKISETLTHEMVEATTDPSGFWGWQSIQGEIGDQCENLIPRSSPFLNGLVSLYFSNEFTAWTGAANACTNSEVNSSQPNQTANVSVCGSGKNARITVSGSFDPSPWDLANGVKGGSRTLFLQGAVSGSHNFTFGDLSGFWNSPADMVGFGPVSWTSNYAGPSCAGTCGTAEAKCIAAGAGSTDARNLCFKEQSSCIAACPPATPVTNQIVIEGFDGAYGAGLLGKKNAIAAISPGDTINITLNSWRSGQITTGSALVPVPTNIKNLIVIPPTPIFVGDAETIFGQIGDAGGCPNGGLDVQLSASDADPNSISPAPTAIPPTTTTTYDDGTFFAQYKPSGPAGIHKVNVVKPIAGSVSVPVHPNAWSLDNSLGPVSGGKTVTLTGSGFDPTVGATKIEFRAPGNLALGTVVTVAADGQTTKFQTPLWSQTPGMVQVVASVNGQESLALPYRYYIPNQPIFSFRIECNVGPQLPVIQVLRVDAYDIDGNPAAEQITLTATYNAFYSGIKPGPGNPAVSTLTIPPGGATNVIGPGPFEATPSADPTLAVTDKFPPDAPGGGCSDPVARYAAAAVSFLPGPGPVETATAQPLIDRGGQFLSWSNTAAPEQPTVSISITGASRSTISSATDVQVRALGTRDLISMARGRPFGFARDRKQATRLWLLGPNLSVAPSRSALSKAWLGSASISFLLPAGSNASEYAILRGGPESQSWIEVPSVSVAANGRTVLRANMGDSGTFVLTRVDPPRH
jgi:hypothetical protein